MFGLLLAICLPVTISCVDIMALSVALADIMQEMHTNLDKTQWLISGYTMGIAACMIIVGRLADKYGRRRMLSYGVILFGLASLECACSNNINLLIGGRFLQGAASAMMMTTSISLITSNFSVEKRGMVFSQWGTSLGLGLSIGPLVGAVILLWLNWRWIFLINLPLCIWAYYLIQRFIIESKDNVNQLNINWIAAGLLSGISILLTILIANSEILLHWKNSWIFLLFAGMCIVFVKLEKISQNPIVDLKLFTYKNFSAATFAGSLSYFCLYAWLFLFNIYLQSALHYSALKASLVMTAYSIVFMMNSRVTGYMIKHKGNKWTMQYGFTMMLFSLVLMANIKITTSLYEYIIMFALFAIGVTSANLPSMNAANEYIPVEKTGTASGMIFTIRWLGGTIGTALITLLFNAFQSKNNVNQLVSMTHALTMSCILLACIALIGFTLATLGLKRQWGQS